VSATRYASVLDLGFGDSGKGRFVDVLTSRWGAHTVVRFNGGAQAGHTVVRPAGGGKAGFHHTFSQFGAGTLVRGTRTVLLDPFVIHPTALVVEAGALARVGVDDALSRIVVDARCRVTTPFLQSAGQWREWLRGSDPHGTCGVGVGETVRHSLEHPQQTLRYSDLVGPESSALEKLQAQRETLLSELGGGSPTATVGELAVLEDSSLASRWLRTARALARQVPPTPVEQLRYALGRPGSVLFEGAQGLLLDEWRGFHPHTTWSSTTPAAVEAAVQSLGLESPIEHYGVLRTYLTRHGAGPMPTEDSRLDTQLAEPHNASDGWQGRFRRGHPDAVLLRYALAAAPELSGLLVSHVDAFEHGVSLRWCEAYQRDTGQHIIDCLPSGTLGDLDHQHRLTQLLFEARPQYARGAITTEVGFLDRVASLTEIPVVLRSRGAAPEAVSGPLSS
jgi:adenylosuccinate synthase